MRLEQYNEYMGPNDEDTRYGATPYLKDYWPNNYPSSITITSSVSFGLTIGVSTKTGFIIGNENGASISSSFGLQYTKSITQQEPHVNSQLDKTGKVAQWSYTYVKETNKSTDIEANILYEVANNSDVSEGDVILFLDYNFGLKGRNTSDNIENTFAFLRPAHGEIEG